MSTLGSSCLPEYDHPPVIEVVIGVQFAELEGFLPIHPGLFWLSIREEYPNVESAPMLPQVIEKFGDSSEGGNPFDTASIGIFPWSAMPRSFFIDESGRWLVQLQSTRLLQNWRKSGSDDIYPRFPAVHQRFEQSWIRLQEFCRREKISQPLVDQLEVTYINHIPKGEGWEAPGEVGLVFPDLNWRSKHDFLNDPEATAWKADFLLPNKCGRLHVAVRQATRKTDGVPVLLSELTARGRPSELSEASMRDWVELAREWIVRGFADLASEQIQQTVWRRTR